MNENIEKIFNQLKRFWAAQTPLRKILFGLGLAVVVAAGIATSALQQKDDYVLLYSDLVSNDMSAVSKKLGELNIPHKVSNEHQSIYISKGNLDQARMELAKEGIPGGDVVGFERFDQSTFGMSSYVQRIQYLRAVQGELVRSIQRIEEVKRARVHLSLPPKKTFLEEQSKPKASVILEMHPGKSVSKKEVKGMAHLVASAVEDLSVQQVTIVDNRGKFLHRPNGEDAEGLMSAHLEVQRSIEETYEKRIVGILAPVVGMDKVIAKVTAEIDRSRTNTTEESFDPSGAVPVGQKRREETSNGSRPNPIGIPGSRANLPGSEVQNPPVPMATANTTKEDRDTQYAVPRKIQTVNKPSGNIRRLTVAVVVDGYYQNGSNGQDSFSPRSEEELRRIQELVANTVGFDPERRDSITVSSLPFKKTDFESLAPLEETTPVVNPVQQLIRNGLVALIVLFFFIFVLRPFLRWVTSNEVEKELELMPQTVAQLESARKEGDLLSLSKAVNQDQGFEPFDKRESGDLRKRILSRLDSSPRKGLQIITEWLADERLAKGEA